MLTYIKILKITFCVSGMSYVHPVIHLGDLSSPSPITHSYGTVLIFSFPQPTWLYLMKFSPRQP